MSEATPEAAPAVDSGPADDSSPAAAAPAPESAPAPADPPAPAPAPVPAPPAAPEPAAPAPEADDDWSDPEKGREAKRKANQEIRRVKAENEALRKQIELRIDPEESKATIAMVEAAAALEVARVKFGYKYGVPEEHLPRLRGETPEEIEADAKSLGPAFNAAGGGLGRGGLDPTDEPEETDPRKLAAQIPRLH